MAGPRPCNYLSHAILLIVAGTWGAHAVLRQTDELERCREVAIRFCADGGLTSGCERWLIEEHNWGRRDLRHLRWLGADEFYVGLFHPDQPHPRTTEVVAATDAVRGYFMSGRTEDARDCLWRLRPGANAFALFEQNWIREQ